MSIIKACRNIEFKILQLCLKDKNFSGSCAVFTLIKDKKLFIGNVGDSRIIVSEL